MYRIMVAICLVTTIGISVAFWRPSPSVGGYFLLILPQSVLLLIFARLLGVFQESRIATLSFSVPLVWIVYLAVTTTCYFITSLYNGDNYFLLQLAVLSWFIQGIPVALYIGFIFCFQSNKNELLERSVLWLAFGLCSVPLWALWIFGALGSIYRTINRL